MIKYIPKHFTIQEILPMAVVNKWGEFAWCFMKPEILYTADQIREYFNVPMTINNYSTNGAIQFRGLRTSDCPEYTPFSQHSFGNAIDFTLKGLNPEEIRDAILKNANKFEYITCIEKDTPTWVHIDARNAYNWDGIKLVNG